MNIKRNILIISENSTTTNLLKSSLNSEFKILESTTIKSVYEQIQVLKIDLLILDLDYPKNEGWRLAANLRNYVETKKILLIMLTGKYISSKYELKGLKLGAQDYILKPLNQAVLIARINNILNRCKNIKISRRKELSLVLSEHKVIINEKEQKLTSTEFKLLSLFINNKKRILTKKIILKSLWGEESYRGYRTAEKHINNLRNKIGKQRILTIRGLGYQYLDIKK